jgi:hypothetical protein
LFVGRADGSGSAPTTTSVTRQSSFNIAVLSRQCDCALADFLQRHFEARNSSGLSSDVIVNLLLETDLIFPVPCEFISSSLPVAGVPATTGGFS